MRTFDDVIHICESERRRLMRSNYDIEVMNESSYYYKCQTGKLSVSLMYDRVVMTYHNFRTGQIHIIVVLDYFTPYSKIWTNTDYEYCTERNMLNLIKDVANGTVHLTKEVELCMQG